MADRDPKSNIPWSVKGVSKEARDAAKKAAAEQGVTMGEWLTQAIRSGGPGAPESSGGASPNLPSPTTGIAPGEPISVESTDSSARLRQGIAETIGQSESRILGVVAPLQEIIQQMALRIELLEQRPDPTQVERKAIVQTSGNVFRKTGWDD